MRQNRLILRFLGWFRRIDKLFWLLMLIIAAFSLLLLKSVSRATNTDYYHTQLVVTVVGLLAAVLLSLIDYEHIAAFWKIIAAFCVAAMVYTLFFGVSVQGEYRVLVPMQEKLGFDDVTRQGLAHYGSNITYSFPVTTNGGKLIVKVPHFAGAGVHVKAGDAEGWILYPPYRTELALPAGTHTLELKLLGNRQNCFGPVHDADPTRIYIGPSAWRSTGNSWTDSYRLRPLGILTAPRIEELPAED